MYTRLVFIVLAVHALPASGQGIVKNDVLSEKNTECAAFYSLMTSLVKPEKKSEYTDKYELHKDYALRLHDSAQSYDERFRGLKGKLAESLNVARTQEDRFKILSQSAVFCATIESHTPLVISQQKSSDKSK